MKDIQSFSAVLEKSFLEIYELHNKLGAEGQREDRTNQFSENALRMDWEAEEVLINNFTSLGIPFLLVSEEHRTKSYGEGDPVVTLVLDGIDGTLVYKSSRGVGTYGTMACVLNGADPTYGDYIVSGFALLSPKFELFISQKGSGKKYASTPLMPISESRISKVTYPESLKNKINTAAIDALPGDKVLAMCAEYAEILMGKKAFFVDYSRKQNLEQIISYGLFKESGGGMFTALGESLEGFKYFEFGQKAGEEELIVTCPDERILAELLNFIRR